MSFRRKAAIGLALALVAATAAVLATGALGSRSAATPPDLAVKVPKATIPFAKKPKCKLTACAWVDNDGTLIWGKNVVGSTRVSTGVYCVQLKDSIKAVNVANVLLTIDYYNTGLATNMSAQWYSPDPGAFWCFGNEITVKTYGNEGGTSTSVDGAFTFGIS